MRGSFRSAIRSGLIAALLLVGTPLLPALAQDASPVASPIGSPTAAGALTMDNMTVVAGGLLDPRGFAWNSFGRLYVAQAGIGGETASVARIDNGCPVIIAPNLASNRDDGGSSVGAAAVAFLGDQLYVLIAGGGETNRNPQMPNGVYRVNADQSVTLIADLSAFIRANPVSDSQPDDYSPEGNPYALAPDAANDALWILEANSGQLLRASLNGTITRVVDFSSGNPVPTALTVDPKGGVYVGFLTPLPFSDDSSQVVHVSETGDVTSVWLGLTMVTSLAVGPNGALYALEFSTGNTTEPPFVVPGSGKIVKQTGPSEKAEIAVGLNMPAFMAFGPDDNLYISLPGIDANDTNGVILMTNLTPGSMPTAAPPVCSAAVPEASPVTN